MDIGTQVIVEKIEKYMTMNKQILSNDQNSIIQETVLSWKESKRNETHIDVHVTKYFGDALANSEIKFTLTSLMQMYALVAVIEYFVRSHEFNFSSHYETRHQIYFDELYRSIRDLCSFLRNDIIDTISNM